MSTLTHKTDIAVAIIFFNRPDCLKRTFDAIAVSRPSRLYLIQDGARKDRPDDITKINQCRNIVEKIGWDCNVTKIYSNENLGCGMRVYSGITEAFKNEDKLVIIEDDIVIGESFLPFCKVMLDRYENDERIGMISGMNHLGKYSECPYDYFFSSQGGAIWGWATWRRVWNDIDWSLQCADDTYMTSILQKALYDNHYAKQIKNNLIEKRKLFLENTKQTSWSFQFGFTTCLAQSRLNIIPTVNLISNIGNSSESVHSSKPYLIPRKLRQVYDAKIYNISETILHPTHILNDMNYAERQSAIMGGSRLRMISRMVERLIYKICPILGKI